jgi:hydrogenase expression/formation protein HypE
MIDTILLNHGSGRGLDELLHTVILPEIGIDSAAPLEDAAVFTLPQGRCAFTTDSFVIRPLEFPGGDIGKLSVCGTINDLAMVGATPHSISVAMIIEEGLDVALLRRILRSIRHESKAAGVSIQCGDTKVVDRGKADGIFIATSGIGIVPPGRNLSVANAGSGDAVVLSGPIGLHGIAVLSAREGLNFASTVVSDCASLHRCTDALLKASPHTRIMRDATRGGCAAVLNEIAEASGVTIMVRQSAIPVPPEVAGACSYLGLDPLQVANEGRFVAIVPAEEAEAAVAACRTVVHGDGACIIGTVEPRGRVAVLLETAIGSRRVVDVPSGELLPRIC